MVSLQYMALDAHIKTGARYDGTSVVIENIIFEVDQLRSKLKLEIEDLQEDYKFAQKVKNRKVYSGTSDEFNNIVDVISTKLFDQFTYTDRIKSSEHIEWKEYFHCLYEIVIPDEYQLYNKKMWFTVPEAPKELDHNDSCWPLIKSISDDFEKLKSEGRKSFTLKRNLKIQVKLGIELLEIKNEIVAKSKILEMYNRIIEWSMH